MTILLYPEITYRVRAGLWQVHRILGPGFREETYKKAAILELRSRGVKVETEKLYDILYQGIRVDGFRLDLVVEEKVVLELKATDDLTKLHESQLISYLRASGLRVGLLVNFGQTSLQIHRRIV
jgi:GxxExxY protein